MFYGLLAASIAAFFACSRLMFPTRFEWTDPRFAVMCAGVVGAWVYRYGRMDRKLAQIVLLYAICSIPGLIYAEKVGMLNIGLGGVPGVYSGSIMASLLCASGLLLAARLSEYDANRLQKAIYACAAITAVHCVMQKFGVDPFNIGPLPQERSVGLIGSAVDAGAMFVAVLSMVGPNILLLIGILMTGSIGALIAGLVAIAPSRHRVRLAIFAIILATAAVFTSNRPSDFARVEVWKSAVASISVNGHGPVGFARDFAMKKTAILHEKMPKYRQIFTHNFILESLVTKGIFGLISLVSFAYFPIMAAMWVISFFNPISFEVTFIACVLSGIHYRWGSCR